jgi:hypothetical protein
MPPLDWWHCLRVRDEPGSLALRGVTTETAKLLLDAEARGELAAELGRLLPGVTHPELVEGVLGVVRHAAEQIPELARYQDLAAAAISVAEPEPVPIDDGLLGAALSGQRYHSAGQDTTVIPAIRQLGKLVNGEISAADVNWTQWWNFWLKP